MASSNKNKKVVAPAKVKIGGSTTNEDWGAFDDLGDGDVLNLSELEENSMSADEVVAAAVSTVKSEDTDVEPVTNKSTEQVEPIAEDSPAEPTATKDDRDSSEKRVEIKKKRPRRSNKGSDEIALTSKKTRENSLSGVVSLHRYESFRLDIILMEMEQEGEGGKHRFVYDAIEKWLAKPKDLQFFDLHPMKHVEGMRTVMFYNKVVKRRINLIKINSRLTKRNLGLSAQDILRTMVLTEIIAKEKELSIEPLPYDETSLEERPYE